MITILDIYDQIKAKENYPHAKSEKEDDELDWKPKECIDYVVPPFSIPDCRTKKCTNEKLSRVLAYVDAIKHIRYAGKCTILPISSTSKRLTDICKSQRNASNLIQFMIKLGLISVECNQYQFNAMQEKYNRSKTYRYYYENELLLKEYCEENNIKKEERRNYLLVDTVVEKFTIDEIDDTKIKFNSKLSLKKPYGFSKSEFEEYVLKTLHKNYPELSYYQQLADQLNSTYYADTPCMQIRFIPHIEWNKKSSKITKIGIRATNPYVSAKATKDGNEKFKGLFREDILKTHGLTLEKDVRSTVPRITLSLNKGKWVTEDVDIYELIYNAYIKLKSKSIAFGFDKSNQSFEKIRPAIKDLHMRGYFDAPNMVGAHTRRHMEKVDCKEDVDAEMKLFQDAVRIAEGGTLFDSEIFYHESCIYMDVLKELLEQGYMTWECYDAWYAFKEGVTQDEFETYVTSLVEKHANAYIKRWLHPAQAA